MFDLFGFKARREALKQEREAERKRKEAKKLEEIQEKKRIYQERKKKITNWLKKYDEKMSSINSSINYERKKRADSKNSTCPKCGSKNVVHKVVRGKGEIHGNGSSSLSGSFDGGLFSIGGSIYGSGHSKIDGEFDTYPVNRCKDCEHEWNVEEPNYSKTTDDFSHYSSIAPGYFYNRIDEYFDLSFDPYDEKEPFNSLEEKQQDFFDKQSKSYILKPYKNIPRYMVEVALYEGLHDNICTLGRIGPIFNYHEDDDKYSYTMSDELWEIVKKILGWEGNEE